MATPAHAACSASSPSISQPLSHWAASMEGILGKQLELTQQLTRVDLTDHPEAHRIARELATLAETVYREIDSEFDTLSGVASALHLLTAMTETIEDDALPTDGLQHLLAPLASQVHGIATDLGGLL